MEDRGIARKGRNESCGLRYRTEHEPAHDAEMGGWRQETERPVPEAPESHRTHGSGGGDLSTGHWQDPAAFRKYLQRLSYRGSQSVA